MNKFSSTVGAVIAAIGAVYCVASISHSFIWTALAVFVFLFFLNISGAFESDAPTKIAKEDDYGW